MLQNAFGYDLYDVGQVGHYSFYIYVAMEIQMNKSNIESIPHNHRVQLLNFILEKVITLKNL